MPQLSIIFINDVFVFRKNTQMHYIKLKVKKFLFCRILYFFMIKTGGRFIINRLNRVMVLQ